METEPKRCWAYNYNAVRCEQDAGHDGPHIVYTSWTDDECYELGPSAGSNRMMPVPSAPTVTAAENTTTIEAAPTKCVACQHNHKGSECPCGCYSHIG